MDIEELIFLLKKRDNITFDEARSKVNECINALDKILHYDADEACDQIIYDYLGLEPDYLPLLLEEII